MGYKKFAQYSVNTLSINASCDSSSVFLLQQKFNSVDDKICANVPKRWNNIAQNWMTKINAKKNTNTKPMGSNCRYSFDMWTCFWKLFIQFISKTIFSFVWLFFSKVLYKNKHRIQRQYVTALHHNFQHSDMIYCNPTMFLKRFVRKFRINIFKF